jgi:hypothetical protein
MEETQHEMEKRGLWNLGKYKVEWCLLGCYVVWLL